MSGRFLTREVNKKGYGVRQMLKGEDSLRRKESFETGLRRRRVGVEETASLRIETPRWRISAGEDVLDT